MKAPKEKKRQTATWFIYLDTECPKCRCDVDLLEAPGFWDNAKFQVGENGTKGTRGVSVVCPACGHGFDVDFIC